jgi:hypothetical protein
VWILWQVSTKEEFRIKKLLKISTGTWTVKPFCRIGYNRFRLSTRKLLLLKVRYYLCLRVLSVENARRVKNIHRSPVLLVLEKIFTVNKLFVKWKVCCKITIEKARSSCKEKRAF